MAARPDIILLPKTAEPAQIAELDAGRDPTGKCLLGRAEGSTELVPNVELARGLMQTYAICRASERVSACLMASEDLANDLGAERSREGDELAYARARFHVECVAAGVVSIDCPYTWTDPDGVRADAEYARRLGYRAKSAVRADHAAVINEVLTPDADAVAQARRIVAAFEAAQACGDGRAEVDGSMVEVPIYLNAKRLLDRALAFGLAP